MNYTATHPYCEARGCYNRPNLSYGLGLLCSYHFNFDKNRELGPSAIIPPKTPKPRIATAQEQAETLSRILQSSTHTAPRVRDIIAYYSEAMEAASKNL